MLVYGIATNYIDEYLTIGESTALECLKNFTAGVLQTFGPEYLRKTTQTNVDCPLAVAEGRECWKALIVCIRSRRTVPQVGK